MSGYSPHPDLRWTAEQVGIERAPLLIVDNFLAETERLIEAASASVYLDVGPIYPGVRAPAPEEYAEALVAILGPLIERVFDAPLEPELDLCAFSMVTAQPRELAVTQRIPHFDGVEPDRLAFLHYLCTPAHGGTSFYRHRSTGFESVDADRLDVYRQAFEADVRREGEPAAAYVDGDTPIFERIRSCEAVFNRILLYRGSALHSGNVSAAYNLEEDARTGRLTVNGFARLRLAG